jgi:hypothetical protein
MFFSFSQLSFSSGSDFIVKGHKNILSKVMEIKSILWFRHGLRLHDNPSLLAAIDYGRKNVTFYPIFIFDGESAGEFSKIILFCY